MRLRTDFVPRDYMDCAMWLGGHKPALDGRDAPEGGHPAMS
jgi:hypothetical protein